MVDECGSRLISEHLQWIAPNYSRALAVAKRLLQHLLSVFDQSGALCSFVMAQQREVLEGNLLCDAFLMGRKDMEGLVQMCMEFLQHFTAHTPPKPKVDDLMCTHCSVCLEHNS
ncbi:unnamed protein product [Sphagnum compactum]